MSSITIEVDNKLLANAIATWFEDGDAVEAFLADRGHILHELHDNGDLNETICDASVTYGKECFGNVDHTVTLYTDDFE